MATWTNYPYAGEFNFDTQSIKTNWARLHGGDREPLPQDPKILEAWALFHNGEFHHAYTLGLQLGQAGFNVANRSASVYATYLEPYEARRIAMFLEVSERADWQIQNDADNINAHFWRACALGHYSQSISVAKALAQGLGIKIKSDLEKVIRYQPNHAGAHFALGSFHAEVIDKVGPLIGAITHGAYKHTGLALFSKALELTMESALGKVEYAQALLMLEGDSMMDEANRLYLLAANAKPMDATERLCIEMAKNQLDDCPLAWGHGSTYVTQEPQNSVRLMGSSRSLPCGKINVGCENNNRMPSVAI